MKKWRCLILVTLMACAWGGCHGPQDGHDVFPDVSADAGTDAKADTRADATGGDTGYDECEVMMIDCESSEYECHGPTTFADRMEGECVGPCCRDGICMIILHECPAGTRCHAANQETGMTGYSGIYPCLPLDCDTNVGPGCPDGSFCDTIAGTCGGPGTCIAMSSGMYPYGQENKHDYSCGCDGTTYYGGGGRVRAGVALAHTGQCCVPERLGFTADNPDGLGMWKACRELSTISGLPADLRLLLEEAGSGENGSLIGCAEGEKGYVGRLDLDESGAIDPGQYDALCRLASFPRTSLVRGEPAEYCDVNCFTDLMCADTTCKSPCGCCPCPVGRMRCVDGPATEKCTDKGCWSYHIPCNPGWSCIEDGESASCRAPD